MSNAVYAWYDTFARGVMGSIVLISAGAVIVHLVSPEFFAVTKTAE